MCLKEGKKRGTWKSSVANREGKARSRIGGRRGIACAGTGWLEIVVCSDGGESLH